MLYSGLTKSTQNCSATGRLTGFNSKITKAKLVIPYLRIAFAIRDDPLFLAKYDAW
jgi:hypothetical protein